MKAFLSRHWFLLLVLVGVFLVWWRPGWVAWTRHTNPTLTGAAAVFLSGLSLESRRLLRALARPGAAVWAVLISYLALPALGWLVSRQFADPNFRVGLMVITCVPCTLASGVIWTRMAGGNEAVSLLVTILSNCTSWLATTAWLLLATDVKQVSLAHAGDVMIRLLVVLVVPVLVGQAARSLPFVARQATKQRPVLSVVSRLLILSIMIKAAVVVGARLRGTEYEFSGTQLGLVAVACVMLHLVALCLGFISSGWFGFDRPTRIAVAIAGSQKTLPVSLILFDTYFVRQYPLAVAPMMFFHVGQLVVDTYLAGRWQRSQVVATDKTVAGFRGADVPGALAPVADASGSLAPVADAPGSPPS